MAKKPKPKFRKGQLVMVVDDGVSPILMPDFVTGIHSHTSKYGWSYRVRGCSYPLAECQIRKIRKKEIR